MKDLHDICVEAANAMVGEGIIRHVSYVSAEDGLELERVVRVTIEFVDAAETVG